MLEQARSLKRMAIRCRTDRIFLPDHAIELFAETIRLDQIADANSAARHFVFIGRADSARRGADLRLSPRGFRGFVHFAVIRKNHMGAIAQEKTPAHVDARFFQVFDFGKQRNGVYDGSGANHGLFSRAQNPAGNQLQDETTAIENNGMPGIVAAGVAGRVVKRRSNVIDDLAFPFVSPLRTHHRYCFGPALLAHPQHPSMKKAAPCPLQSDLETLQEGLYFRRQS